MSLNDKQVQALLAPLHPGRVRQVQGNAHLEAWDVRRHLLRVFGWGGWEFHVASCDLVSERSKWDEQNTLRGRHTVVYRVIGRLVIKDPAGTVLAVYEDGATGDAANQPSLGDAHDMAMKTAMSQALKRCAMNLGDRFGLSLYAKGSTEAVVVGSLAHLPDSPAEGKAEDVQSGEMDQPEVQRPAERVKADASEQTPWTEPVARPPWDLDAFAVRVGEAMTREALLALRDEAKAKALPEQREDVDRVLKVRADELAAAVAA